MTSQDLVERLLELPDKDAQKQFLEEHISLLNDEVAGALKDEATRLLRSDVQLSLEITDLLFVTAKLTDNPLHRALALLAEANARSMGGLGEFQRAVELYDEAAAVYQTHGCAVEQATSQIGKVFSLAFLGRYDEALEAGRWAGQVLEEREQWHPLVRLTMNLAVVHGRQRADAEALAQFDRAQALCERLGSDGTALLQLVETNRAIVLRNLGRFDESIQAGQTAGELADTLGHKAMKGHVQEGLAFTYLLLGRYNEALELLDQARDVFLSDGRQSDAVAVELVIANCLLQLRRFDDVLEKCHKVKTSFTEQGTRREVADATLYEAVAYAGLRRYSEALASLAEARDLFKLEGNHVRAAAADLESAVVLYHQHQFEASLATAQSCADVFHVNDLAVQQAQAFLIASRSLTALDRVQEARDLLTQALTVGEAKDLPSLTYQCRHILGAAAEAQGDLNGAMAEYDRAIADLERLRGRLMVEFRADFLEDKQSVYEDIVFLCLNLDDPLRGLEYAERAKSRALLDMLTFRLDLSIRARDGQDYRLVDELEQLRAKRDRLYRRWQSSAGFGLRGQAVSNGDQEMRHEILILEKQITELWHKLLIRNADYARDASLWHVRTDTPQPYLSDDTLLLEYFIARGELVAFLATAETVQAQRLPVDLAGVQRLLQLLWLNMKAVPKSSLSRIEGLTQNALGILQRLYNALIAPLSDAIAAFPNLIIVPHGPLHYLPFHALHDGQAYLLERHGISYLPGASVLRYCQEVEPAGADLVAVGHSYDGALPHAVQEAQSIAALFAGQALLEDAATPAQLQALAGASRVLHLATHGDFRPDNPLFSGLALAGGWLTTQDIFGLRLQASLVTLSACQTGRNVVAGGDELLGLMRAFLYAGAASLVLSLWAVEDRSTAQLMETFYSNLAAGMTKGAALRSAQLQLATGESQDGDPSGGMYAHPYFWAPFFLTGDNGAL